MGRISFLVIILLLLLSGCSPIDAFFEDNTYLTPIPEATLLAYQEGDPLETRLQAVIAARVELGSTHLRFKGTPEVVLAEKTSLGKALKTAFPGKTAAELYEHRSLLTRVWLVIFSGKFTIQPPPIPETEAAPTPSPQSIRCVFVIMETHPGGPFISGTVDCP